MKKVLIIALTSFTLNSYAQTDSTKKKSLDCYFAASVSMSTGDNFKQNSYPSIELGVCFKNIAFGINTGRFNFDESPYGVEKYDYYYYELKTVAYFPLGSLKGYAIAGWGQYKPNHSFIEYGGGFVYSIKKFDLIMQVSNWDRIVYLSPGIAYNFTIK